MSEVSLKGSGKLIFPTQKLKSFNILALDLGTHCGWASLKAGVVESGVQEFDLRRGESPGMRFIRFNAWLDDVIELISPSLVVYELAHHRGGYATELLLGMVTRVQEACARWSIPYSGVHSATLKKKATGHGRASKEEMMKVASSWAMKDITDDNEADAIMLLVTAKDDYVV